MYHREQWKNGGEPQALQNKKRQKHVEPKESEKREKERSDIEREGGWAH